MQSPSGLSSPKKARVSIVSEEEFEEYALSEEEKRQKQSEKDTLVRQYGNIQTKLQTLIEGQYRVEQNIIDMNRILLDSGQRNNVDTNVTNQFSTGICSSQLSASLLTSHDQRAMLRRSVSGFLNAGVQNRQTEMSPSSLQQHKPSLLLKRGEVSQASGGNISRTLSNGGNMSQTGSVAEDSFQLSQAPSGETVSQVVSIHSRHTISDPLSTLNPSGSMSSMPASGSRKSMVIGDLRRTNIDASDSNATDEHNECPFESAQDLPSDWPACVEMHAKLMTTTDRSALASCKAYLVNANRTISQEGGNRSGSFNLTGSFNLASVGYAKKVPMRVRLVQFTMSPTSRLRVMFDCITALATVYDLLTTPFYLAWDLEATGTAKLITYATASYWTLDMFISARTGFFRNGDLVMEPGQVLKHYIKTWFIPDLLLVLTDWMVMFMAEDAQGLSLLRMYKMVKLARLVRLARLIQVFKRFMDRSTSDLVDTYLQIFQVVFSTLWSTHLLACMWFAIGRLAPQGTGESWLKLSLVKDNEPFEDAEHVYQYASAFHWGMQMMTMGAMDVIPTNSTERFFSAFCLVFGLVFFSSMISMFNAKLMQILVERQGRSQQISLVRQVLGRFTVSQHLAAVVQLQVVKRMKNKPTLTFSEVQAFNLLPLSTQMALRVEMCDPNLHARAFFWLWAKLDKTGYSKFCFGAVNFRVLSAGDNLFLAGATDDIRVYIALRGSITYKQELLPAKTTTNRTVDVSSGTWMCEAALWSKWMTVGKAEAKTECEVTCIVVEEFLHHVLRNRLMKNIAQEYAVAFTFRMSNSATEEAFPDDLQIPNSEAIDIVMNTSLDVQVLFGLVTFEYYRSSWAHFPLLPDTYLQLREEVEKGQCALALDERGEVVRGVAIGVLHLTNTRGEILARIGEWDGNQVSVACELPGSKCQVGETADVAVRRMLEEDLPYFADQVHFKGTDGRDEESSLSKKFRMRTKYLRIAIHAGIDKNARLSCLEENKLTLNVRKKSTSKAVQIFASMGNQSTTTSHRSSFRRQSSMDKQKSIGRVSVSEFDDRDVFMLKSAKGKDYLYTWMAPSIFYKFHGGSKRHSTIAKFLGRFHYSRSSSLQSFPASPRMSGSSSSVEGTGVQSVEEAALRESFVVGSMCSGAGSDESPSPILVSHALKRIDSDGSLSESLKKVESPNRILVSESPHRVDLDSTPVYL